MSKRFLQFFLLVSALFIETVAAAQNTAISTTTIESTMRSNGKIYVVMAVCITILTGLILYVISIDRKISKIEKQDQ